MLIYLYGPDSYRRQDKLREILAKYKEKHNALSIERFYLESDNDLARLQDFLKSQSLFDEFKLGIIYPEHHSKELALLLKTQLEIKNVVLIISAEKLLSKEFTFLLNKPALAQEFKELGQAQVVEFIQKEAARRQLKISADAVSALGRSHGSNLWGIINDLDKLALGGKLEDSIAAPEFFALINRAKRGDLTAITWLLETEEPAMVFNIVTAQTIGDLKIKMADYDAAIKSGKLEYEEALLDLAVGR